jgi:hypothetical protein
VPLPLHSQHPQALLKSHTEQAQGRGLLLLQVLPLLLQEEQRQVQAGANQLPLV